jgi:8-hydroxy-5-deazaflavin:NADPH oxidoreductase
VATLAIIGSGNIGTTIGRLAVMAGIDVILSNSRGPQTLAPLVAALGPRARAGSAAEARSADWVLLAIPFANVQLVDPAPLRGRIVLETTNYYPQLFGRNAQLEASGVTSSAFLQQHLEGAQLVKAFNGIYSEHIRVLARRSGAPDRTAIPIAANDPGALTESAHLLDLLGFDSVTVGDLSQSWRIEPGTPAWVTPYQADPTVYFTHDPGAPARTAEIQQAVEAATRTL